MGRDSKEKHNRDYLLLLEGYEKLGIVVKEYLCSISNQHYQGKILE